jgi:hypothetical protein
VELFNGKDLNGWDGLKDQFWSVKDGAIVGRNDKKFHFNTFLWTQKKYKDFELKFQVRLNNGEGNSGVQFRSKIKNAAQFSAEGPQGDMGGRFWGSLYGENFDGVGQEAPADVVNRALKPTEFNEYYVKVLGKHVTIKLNGFTTVDGEFPKMPEDGLIGLQLHGGHITEATFKDFEFTELGAASKTP